VTLFSMVALVPAVLIALVFGVLVNRGVDQWFSDNVTVGGRERRTDRRSVSGRCLG
jgi:hypothetical protein